MNHRRNRFAMYIPVALLGLIALGWTGFWWHAAQRLETAVDAWIQREAAAGRLYACGERSIGGYPFRLEISCEKPRAELPADGGPVHLTATRFLAMAHVYAPTRVYGELHGPLTIGKSKSETGMELMAGWSSAIASLTGSIDRLERVSVVVERFDLRNAADERPLVAAQKLEVHARPTPDAGEGAYDATAGLDQARLTLLDDILGDDESSLRLNLSVRGLDDLRPRRLSESLRAFAEAGGNVRIKQARLERPGTVLQSEGDIRLDELGRPQGQLDLVVQGGESLLGKVPALRELGPVAAAGLGLLGQKTTLDNRPALGFRLNIKNGNLVLAGIKLGEIQPLY